MLAKAGKQGVMLLLSDSTNAERRGVTGSEASVGRALRDIFAAADQRIIVASFASHIHRVQQVCDAAVSAGRKVVVTGRSMVNNTRIARELGYLEIDDENICDAFAMADLPPEKVVVLSTGSQGEPLSALARIANGDHKTVEVESGDTVVISASPVPGNERAVGRVINRLAKAGAKVMDKTTAEVHVSGHAAAEELKLMLNLVSPQYFLPVHGETRHLKAHARLAEETGVLPQNIFVLDNGDCLEIDEKGARVTEHVESGVVYVDGLSVGRRRAGRLARPPAARARRHRHGRDRDRRADRAGRWATPSSSCAASSTVPKRPRCSTRPAQRVAKTLAKTAKEGATDHSVIKNAVRESLSQLLWERIRPQADDHPRGHGGLSRELHPGGGPRHHAGGH